MSGLAPSRLAEVWARSPRMAGRRIGDQFVLVPLSGGGADVDSFLSLNRVAAFVWERLDGSRSGDDVVDAVVEQFAVERPQAERDYLELVEQLVAADAVFVALRVARPDVGGDGGRRRPDVVDRPGGGD